MFALLGVRDLDAIESLRFRSIRGLCRIGSTAKYAGSSYGFQALQLLYRTGSVAARVPPVLRE